MRIGSLKQLQAAVDRLCEGWNNTDYNYLRNQAVLIEQRMEQLQLPTCLTGYAPRYNAWNRYDAKMDVLRAKLKLIT